MARSKKLRTLPHYPTYNGWILVIIHITVNEDDGLVEFTIDDYDYLVTEWGIRFFFESFNERRCEYFDILIYEAIRMPRGLPTVIRFARYRDVSRRNIYHMYVKIHVGDYKPYY
jgi:hypothetical protein